MERSCYSIEKHHDRWLVSVGGAKVLMCDSKRAAMKAVRQATDALCASRAAATCGQQARLWPGQRQGKASVRQSKN